MSQIRDFFLLVYLPGQKHRHAVGRVKLTEVLEEEAGWFLVEELILSGF